MYAKRRSGGEKTTEGRRRPLTLTQRRSAVCRSRARHVYQVVLVPSEKKATSHNRMKNTFPCAWEVNTKKNVVLWHTLLAEFCLL